MAAGDSGSAHESCNKDRIAELYSKVEQPESLPRCWSPKDKFMYIGLSQNNLRVHYKGVGKTHKDAASVRANNPIPAACGLYYFEIKVVSKGRDGYIGVGLSAQGVNTNRLPGWEKYSYGYHGDDGHSFCSSGTGQTYGPTFSTGDIVGCGVNLTNNSCFYTKNGINLGVAFTDLPPNLYPTVGLQTPGEVIDTNFGQQPFVFNLDEMKEELHSEIKSKIERFPMIGAEAEWQDIMQKVVSSYLVHHGYCATAEAFARSTGQAFPEDITSIRNRQRMQKLILSGRISEGIETMQSLYPGLLSRHPHLMFRLKCRQFIEMVAGTDSEVRPTAHSPTRSARSSPCPSPARIASSCGCSQATTNGNENRESAHPNNDTVSNGVEATNSNDVTMESNEMNGSESQSSSRGNSADQSPSMKQLCGGNLVSIEKLLAFGKEIQILHKEINDEFGRNEENEQKMRDAFSLLAYSDPSSSPLGHLLLPVEREPLCAALNKTILESHGLPGRPPLEVCVGQTRACLKRMATQGLGSCAFTDVKQFIVR